MGILNDFKDLMTQDVSLYQKVTTVVNTVPSTVWSLVETVQNCAFYEGASANSFVSDKFRAKTDGVIIINPANITNTILDSFKIEVDSRKFLVVHSDDVMLQGEVIAVAVAEDKSD